MNRQGHEQVKFFIGPEVEYTPANTKRTLFVVDKQPIEDILSQARENRVNHIFMGANHSFSADITDTYWDETITALLDRGYWVTLDYQAHDHVTVLKMLNAGIWQSRIFVPLLGVRIPHVQTSNINLTIKIDDIDFAATNDGVWCLHHSEITDSNRFTSWGEYSTDEILDSAGKVVEAPKVKAKPVAPAPVVEEVTTNAASIDPVEELNDNQVGLDTEEKEAKVEEVAQDMPTTAQEAAEAYAGDEPAKAKKGKKAE